MGRKSGEKTGLVHCHSQGGNQVSVCYRYTDGVGREFFEIMDYI